MRTFEGVDVQRGLHGDSLGVVSLTVNTTTNTASSTLSAVSSLSRSERVTMICNIVAFPVTDTRWVTDQSHAIDLRVTLLARPWGE